MLDLELENEVFNDFKTCLDQLDFKHIRPTSPEMIAAINVGTMWRLIHKMNKREMEAMAMNGEMKNTEHYSEEEHQKMAVDMTVEMQEINDKLKEVENQYDRYVITEKDHYHKFAMEGLAQAEMMIKDAGSKMSEAEYKDKMKCYEDWYISLHHKLNDVK